MFNGNKSDKEKKKQVQTGKFKKRYLVLTFLQRRRFLTVAKMCYWKYKSSNEVNWNILLIIRKV